MNSSGRSGEEERKGKKDKKTKIMKGEVKKKLISCLSLIWSRGVFLSQPPKVMGQKQEIAKSG